MPEKIFCYFHNDDMDGWISSAVVKMKHPNAEFFGYNYEPELPLVKGYDIVYMVDCSADNKDIKKLMKNNKKFVWIDHHAKKILETYNELGTDIEGFRDTESKNAACVLTWKYLFPNKEVPHILKIVEDMDIWKWKLPYSRKLNTALFVDYKNDRDGLIKLIAFWLVKRDKLIEHGKNYIKMRNGQVEFLLKTMHIKDFWGYKTGVVNSPLHTSFIGHEILKQRPDIKVALIWYNFKDNIFCSLRSRGDVDVAKLAAIYDGGGHRPASGFRLRVKDKKNRDVYLE